MQTKRRSLSHPATMPAFLTPLSAPQLPRPQHATKSPRRPIVAKAKKPSRSAKQSLPETPPPANLRVQLKSALSGLNRGLAIDADQEFLTPEEAEVEDLIIALEDCNPTTEPARSPLLPGEWALVYTSSSITRFFGGVTGLQRLLPSGEVGQIKQVIDPEDGTSEFVERITFELPIVGDVEWTAVAEGGLRKTSEVRLLWEAEKVNVGRFSWFADGWKTLRAFQISDTTYLDDALRITRGTTGSVNVYERINA